MSMTVKPMSPEETVMKRMNAAKRHDASILANLYATEAVLSDPSYPQPVVEKENIRKVWDEPFGSP
jgi:ketosteroid isomerase-like protein